MGTQHIIGWEKGVAANAVFTIAASAATIVVSVQLKDFAGNNLTEMNKVDWYISSDITGLTASTVTSATVATGIQGTIVDTYSYYSVSTAAGEFSTTLDGTGANSRYMNVVLPNGRVIHSAIITFSA